MQRFVISKNHGAMLEYTKVILQKVSFSPFLFKKELKKSLKWLSSEEMVALRKWCLTSFGDIYQEDILDAFQLSHI